jgi:hypothetical protein
MRSARHSKGNRKVRRLLGIVALAVISVAPLAASSVASATRGPVPCSRRARSKSHDSTRQQWRQRYRKSVIRHPQNAATHL